MAFSSLIFLYQIASCTYLYDSTQQTQQNQFIAIATSLPSDVSHNLKNIEHECYNDGSQFWGSFWLFTDDGQLYFEMYEDNIYFQSIFAARYWLGIGWNEECQNCTLSATDYKTECHSQCLNDNSFVVIGRHDLTKYRGWGIIDVDVTYNSSLSNYTLYNKKNVPHSIYNQQLDINNVVFFKPPNFTEYSRNNIRAQFQRLYSPVTADNWSRMYQIELGSPSTPTCITYISSKGTNEHSSISSQYTQTPEIVQYWDVACVNVSGLFFVFFILHFVRLPTFLLFRIL